MKFRKSPTATLALAICDNMEISQGSLPVGLNDLRNLESLKGRSMGLRREFKLEINKVSTYEQLLILSVNRTESPLTANARIYRSNHSKMGCSLEVYVISLERWVSVCIQAIIFAICSNYSTF